MLIDSHCHIDGEDFAENLPDIFSRMAQADVKGTLVAGCSLADYQRGLVFAEKHKNVWYAAGVHPSTTDDEHEASIEELVALTSPAKVVAIGECGLDYHYNQEPLDWQRARFARHIQAARKAKLPVVVHSRDANEDTIRILRENGAEDCGFVLHCFCGDSTMAQEAVAMGGYVSFSGILTFKSATEIQATARIVPADRILVETDCPYLAPVPYRGKKNEPSYVRYTAQALADLRGVDLETVARQTTENFFRLFSKARYEA